LPVELLPPTKWLIETSSTIIDGDVLLAVVALLIAFFGSYLVARRKAG
jgi:hypothetical protein